MVSTWMLITASLMNWQDTPDQNRAATAERELRKHGALFRPIGLSVTFMPEHRVKLGRLTDEDIAKLHAAHAKFAYLVFDKDWKGGQENLKYLRDMPNLREIVWGGNAFHDGWCNEIESLTQLEGLFFGGKLTDRGLAVVASLPNLKALSLVDTNVTDDGLRHLKELKKLRWLSLSGARNITDKGLVHLKDLKNLEELSLEVTKTTPAGLVHLQGLTKLTRVRLSSYADPENPLPENPMGMKHLANMTELRMLDARSFCAGDDDLKYLRNLAKLEDLNLCYTKVTDKGLEHLAGLTALKELDLFGTQVTGDGLKHLGKLKNLTNLVLGFCPLEDGAAQHLRQMKQLKYLEITDTNMSKMVIEQLKRDLPETTVR